MSPPSSEAVIHVLRCTQDYSKVMYDLIIVKRLAFPVSKTVFLYWTKLVFYLRGDFYIANDHILVFFLFFRKILIPFTSIFLQNFFVVFVISSRWILPFIFKSSFILFNYRCHCKFDNTNTIKVIYTPNYSLSEIFLSEISEEISKPSLLYSFIFLFENVFTFFKTLASNSSYHCAKSVCIRSYSGPYFPAFRLNTERYEVSPCILSKCG